MRHRHRPDLKPTERLFLAALGPATEPLCIGELAELTGSAPSTLVKTSQALFRRGTVLRHRIGGLNHFTLPTLTPLSTTEVTQ
jgi:hypothetical protein